MALKLSAKVETLGYAPPLLTLYSGIFELPPGHILIWQSGSITITPYWNIDWDARYPGTLQEAEEELRSLMNELVREHLVSDVPLGAFLSGGLDSSAIVAYTAKHAKSDFETYTIAFQDKKFDLSPMAQAVARHLGVRQHIIRVEDLSVGEETCRFVLTHVGQPFADSSCIPTWLISKAAAQLCKVALSGDGGDELFAGYENFAWRKTIEQLSVIPSWVRRGAHGLLSRLPRVPFGNDLLRQIRKALYYSSFNLDETLLHLQCILDPEEVGAFTEGTYNFGLHRLRRFLRQYEGEDAVRGSQQTYV